MKALAVFVASMLFLALPAQATQDQWPALFDVVGVAGDDVLNIRSEPSATAEIIGTLSPDATGVEVIRPSDRSGWGLVNSGEQSGWVALRFLRRQAGQWLGAPIETAQCFGTEPFWSLEMSGTGAMWRSQEGTQTGQVIDRFQSANRRDTQGLSLRFSEGPLQDGFGVLRLAACNDGMSDRNFGIAADFIFGGAASEVFVSGCCTLAR